MCKQYHILCTRSVGLPMLNLYLHNVSSHFQWPIARKKDPVSSCRDSKYTVILPVTKGQRDLKFCFCLLVEILIQITVTTRSFWLALSWLQVFLCYGAPSFTRLCESIYSCHVFLHVNYIQTELFDFLHLVQLVQEDFAWNCMLVL